MREPLTGSPGRERAVESPGPSLPQFPSGTPGKEAPAGVQGGGSSGSPRPQESSASRPYKGKSAGANQRRGRGRARSGRRTRQVGVPPSRRPVPPSRPAAAAAGMSSTQFNKGPSYGLSAEVKNRVSEGRPGEPRLRAPAHLGEWLREESGPPRPGICRSVLGRPPGLRDSGEQRDLRPGTAPASRSH